MKFGIRTPNLKNRVKARTTGKVTRQMKKAANPLYGKQGMGVIHHPKKAAYDAVYHRTSVDLLDLLEQSNDCKEPEPTGKGVSIGDWLDVLHSFFQLLGALIKVAFALALVIGIIAFLVWIL